MQDSMEAMLYSYGVDVVFAGHVHAYERCHRVFNHQLDACGPVYINIGDGGNREGLSGDWVHPQPEWSALREASFGYGTLELQDARSAVWRWHRNQDDAATVSDEVTLVRDPQCKPGGAPFQTDSQKFGYRRAGPLQGFNRVQVVV